MNLASLVAEVLLNKLRHHHTETIFIFSIFVPISRPRSILSYLCNLFFIFIFIFIMINRMDAETLVLLPTCLFFRISPIIFFQIAEVQPQGIA